MIFFQSERLTFRTLKTEDAITIFKWLSDPEVSKYMPYPTYTSVDDAVDWISSNSGKEKEKYFAVIKTENEEMIGNCSLEYLTDREIWSFGYNFAREHWNCGYATETAKALTDYAVKNYGAKKIGADCVAENFASKRVMEKLGMKLSHIGETEKLDKSEKFVNEYYEKIL